MAKIKTAFFCKNCGAQSAKWIGKCPACGEWNTYEEEIVEREEGRGKVSYSTSSKPVAVQNISESNQDRMDSGSVELNRVLGGGMVPGSVILVGGEPGIGKSTLMLQASIQKMGQKVLYISGEESEQQVQMRAKRIGIKNPECFILTETNLQQIQHFLEELKPQVVVVDSVQTLQSSHLDASAGSIPQVKECAAELQKFAKSRNVPVFLIGHITKDGSIAGPKLLEHMVDTVLVFEGERNYDYRILRAVKNRFGSTSELGIFAMESTGLKEISNPSEVLIPKHDGQFSGTSVAATIEGIRPLLLEVQALVSPAVYGTPQRSGTGFDLRRLNMLLAVIEKRSGIRMGARDVFINITGGLRIEDPASDLAVVAAIVSSNADIAIAPHTCFAGEVGLTGEIRPVNRIEQRIAEASRIGFKTMYISSHNSKSTGQVPSGLRLIPATRLDEVLEKLFA
jgi:DNA repair protein RadA/Sms